MRNSEVNEELFSANNGRVAGALPSPAAVKPLSFSHASTVLSSFTGSVSPQQQGVDCHLAFWQSMQKQQTDKDISGNQQPRMLVQYSGSIAQTNKDPRGNQQSHMPVQYPGVSRQSNNDRPGTQLSQIQLQYPEFAGTAIKDPSGTQHSHMLAQYLGIMTQTNKDPPGIQSSHLPVQYQKFIEQTNRDPPRSQHSHVPMQYPRFIDPQLKELQNLRSNMEPPKSNHSQLPRQHFGLTKDQLEELQNLRSNLEPPSSHLSKLPQQHIGVTKDKLESLQWLQYIETPWNNDAQLHPQHPNSNENPLKTGGIPASVESLPRRTVFPALKIFEQDKSAVKQVQDVNENPRPIPPLRNGNDLPRASYKGKEKVTSPLSNVQSFTSVMKASDSKLPPELWEALEGCSPPGPDIPDPYGETDGAMSDIPFFKNTKSSSSPLGVVLSLPANVKDLPSRKGKEVMTVNEKRRRKD